MRLATEFANPWHDELGRFAPKGTGRRFPGVDDAVTAAHALLHDEASRPDGNDSTAQSIATTEAVLEAGLQIQSAADTLLTEEERRAISLGFDHPDHRAARDEFTKMSLLKFEMALEQLRALDPELADRWANRDENQGWDERNAITKEVADRYGIESPNMTSPEIERQTEISKAAQFKSRDTERLAASTRSKRHDNVMEVLRDVRPGFGTERVSVVLQTGDPQIADWVADAGLEMPGEWVDAVGTLAVRDSGHDGGRYIPASNLAYVPSSSSRVSVHEVAHAVESKVPSVLTGQLAYVAGVKRSVGFYGNDLLRASGPFHTEYAGVFYGETIGSATGSELLATSMEEPAKLARTREVQYKWMIGMLASA